MAARRQECSICMDSFKNPKLISCHHSFCCNCLEDYVRANLRNGRFNCPMCRKSVELPKGGVQGFQSNFYIDDTESGEKFACDLCGPKNVACSRCLDCEENLCQTCCYGHEKSKASRHHKISELGTLDSETKGKIRQRIFCDQHPEDEIRLFCRDCKVLICLMCKAVNHDNHTSRTVADYAAEMKKTLQSKKNECSDKLKRIKASKAIGKELDRKINDAEREEIKAVEDQHLQLNKVLEQEVAKVKARIQKVYHDLRQQNTVFKRSVEEEIKTCYNANDNVQNLTDQGTDIDIIRNGPDIEQLISASISKTDPTPNTVLKNKLFSPAQIDSIKLIPLIGTMEDSTDAKY
ncbi:hypothetical protein CHS0354_027046 [Potamilus streckersoni]|uniref:Uncharacterized protein n=1 Tax=Potamilus streckersoni TaxID=2493646 RepID=A0AAE0RMN2_9BIVA|nr:hypothetical protein CHS0354_027046 [Potamilus streckersoni]